MGLKNVIGKAGLTLRKHSPEILGAIGMVCTIAGVVWAVKSTVDSADDIKECQDEVREIKECVAADQFSKKEGTKRVIAARVRCAKTVGVRYVGPVALVGCGLFCQYKGRSILGKRLNSLAAAYTALESRYKLLEDNVRRDYGEDELNRLKYGLRSQKGIVRKVDDVGNEMDQETVVEGVPGIDNVKPFTIIFDNRSGCHHNSVHHCLGEFQRWEKQMTEWLPIKKTIWLDWALEKLDIHPENKEQAQLWHSICWTYKPGVAGHDNEVRLRWRQVIDPDDDGTFIADYNPVFILDPNYDTNMYQEWYQPRK